MPLEVKVILHSARTQKATHIANLIIEQVGKGEGSRRDYAATAWWEEADLSNKESGQVYTRATRGVVRDHDRNQDVWELVRKAIESLEL